MSRSQSYLRNLIILVLFACCTITHVVILTAEAQHRQWSDAETDRLALLSIKSNLHSNTAGSLLTSWNTSVHHCSWEGITCGDGDGDRRVTDLNLTYSGLSGTLSPAVGNLSFLQYLDLSYNFFTGHIPQELTSLTQLKTLSIYHNNFTGTINFIGNLTNLTNIDISENGFSGRIPESIGTRLTGLTFLSFGGNSFTGRIPSSIYNLSRLTFLDFGGSPLHGTLPDSIGLTLPLLRHLHIMDTRLSGHIPSSINNLTHLSLLDLSKNRLSGRIPLDGRTLPNLSFVYLAFNRHLGTAGGITATNDLDFIDTLVNCTHLYRIILTINNLGGTLPASIANLSANSMKWLEFGANALSGEIPDGLDRLENLEKLNLEQNALGGRIPDRIGRMADLSMVDLSYNHFSGEIPDSLGNLSRLTSLYLGYNELRGRVPPSIVNPAGSLQSLSLKGNKLTGEIPAGIFDAKSLSVRLYLSGNRFNGSLPKEVGELVNLGELDVSDNNLSGEIPVSLGKCVSLTKLNLSGNEFSGPVPESLESLKGVSELDLSSNRLTGKIPVYLSSFVNLEWLNLSRNEFEGEVPSDGVFRFPGNVSVVGNKNLCGGVSRMNLPKCPRTGGELGKERKRRIMLIVVFLVVSILSVLLVATIVLWLLFRFRRSKRKYGGDGTSREEGGRRGPGKLLQVSYNELRKATNGFSSENLIGTGEFGSVYKGVLQLEVVEEEGRVREEAVAVKVLNLEHGGAAKSFMRECEALRNIRHRNLVRIRSACSSIDFQGNDFKALVYDLMPRGSLDQWLHSGPVPLRLLPNDNVDNGSITSGVDDDNNTITKLNLLQRISIAIDVACALDYLHNDCKQPLVHCDLKPSNILLDNNMVARVGDFGLARLIPDRIKAQSISSSAGVPGTIGYAPPEYGLAHQISSNGDVYSYGIILLEMMTAKRPTEEIFTNTTLSLHDYASAAAAVGPNDVLEIADPSLLEADEIMAANVESYDRRDVSNRMMLESLVSAVKVGVECSARSPRDRMNIKDAIRELRAAKDKITGSRRV